MKLSIVYIPFVLISVIALFACSKDHSKTFSTCDTIGSFRILDENERFTECIHYEVYLYLGEYYTLCSCCFCDKLAIPANCEGTSLCNLDGSSIEDNCWTLFYSQAEYLFSVASK